MGRRQRRRRDAREDMQKGRHGTPGWNRPTVDGPAGPLTAVWLSGLGRTIRQGIAVRLADAQEKPNRALGGAAAPASDEERIHRLSEEERRRRASAGLLDRRNRR